MEKKKLVKYKKSRLHGERIKKLQFNPLTGAFHIETENFCEIYHLHETEPGQSGDYLLCYVQNQPEIDIRTY